MGERRKAGERGGGRERERERETTATVGLLLSMYNRRPFFSPLLSFSVLPLLQAEERQMCRAHTHSTCKHESRRRGAILINIITLMCSWLNHSSLVGCEEIVSFHHVWLCAHPPSANQHARSANQTPRCSSYFLSVLPMAGFAPFGRKVRAPQPRTYVPWTTYVRMWPAASAPTCR